MKPSATESPCPPIGGRIATALVCIAAAAVMALPAAADAAKPRGIYWGAQIGDQITGEAAPWDMRPVYRFARIAGKGLSLIQFGSPFAECRGGSCTPTKFPTTPLENIRRYGAIPVFSWNSTASPPSIDQPAYSLSRLNAGVFDDYIRDFAVKAREWGHPFFLRFDWEMNGFWFPWSEGVNGNRPREFVKAWRRVHDIFEREGADNVTWVWCPNVDLYNQLTPLGTLYPGDAYVDWTALDGFNWGKRRGSPGWQTFNQVYHRTYKRIVTRVAPRKPLMISEVASTDRGGSKARWIKDMFSKIRRKYGRIRGVIWYDVNDRGTHWPIESGHRGVRKSFRRSVRSRDFRPNVFGSISSSPIAPPSR